MNSKTIFIGGFFIFVGVHTYYELKTCHDLPWPPHFISAASVFGLLSLFSGVNEELANVMAVGFVLAALVKKGFTGDCSHSCQGTPAPASTSAFTTGIAPGQTLA